MRRNSIGVQIGLAVMTAIMLPIFAFAQTEGPLNREFMFTGGGARAAALGGAFIGIADDASASYWNPAGMAQNDRVYMAFDWGFGGQRTRNELRSPADLALLAYDNSSSQRFAQFDFLAFNSPVHIKGQQFYLSASWLRGNHVDFSSEELITDFSGSPPDPTGALTLEQERFSALSTGGPAVATLGAATWFKEELFSMGFGLNIYSGSKYDSTSFLVDGLLLEFPNPTALPLRGVFDQSDKKKFSGLNFTVGTMFHASQLSVGAVVRTPYTMTVTHDVREASAQFERTPDSVLLRQQSSVLLVTDTELDVPLQLGLGFAYRPQENLLLALDYEFTGYSSSELRIQADFLDPKSEFMPVTLNWKDAHQIRFGMEYKVDVGWGSVPLRAGFRVDPLPYSHQTEIVAPLFGTAEAIIFGEELPPTESVDGDQVVGEVYSLGAGVEWNQIRVDLTWEYHTSSNFGDGYFLDSFLRPQFIVEQSLRNQRLLVGFTGYF